MKFKEIYNLTFDDNDLLSEAPHILLSTGKAFDPFLERVMELDNPSLTDLITHLAKRFIKQRLTNEERGEVYNHDILNKMLHNRFTKTFDSKINPEGKTTVKERIEIAIRAHNDRYEKHPELD